MPLKPGALLNHRYRIERILGQGGFGAVYLAHDEDLGIPCAVKENLNTSPQAERQFRREATLLATLRHPHLPRVTNHFLLAGQQYLVMDFVEGEDLKTRLEQGGPLSTDDALRWITQLCDALTYLHSLTPPVIHRDIKPANIKITPAGEAVLVDFGIAKVAESGQRTMTGAMALTSGYAPPEQYQLGATDGRTDEYALAATLYHLLTGQVPPDSVERLIGQAALTPPEQLRPDLPAHVTAALKKALEIRPDQRFMSVADLQRALTDPNFTYEASALIPGSLASMEPAIAEPTRPARRSLRAAWWIAAGVIGAAAVIGLGIVGAAQPSLLRAAFASATTTASATQPATSTATPTETPIPPTTTPTPSPAPTNTIPPTSTPLPTFTPTLVPISAANVSRLTLLHRLGRGRFLDVQWSPDSRYLAVNTTRGAYVHDGQTLELLKVFEAAYLLALGPAGQAVILDAVEAKVVDWPTGRVVKTLGEYDVRAAAFSPDGKTLVIGGDVSFSGRTNALALLDFSHNLLRVLDDGRTQWGGDLMFTPDGKLLLSAGPIAVWDLSTLSRLRPPISGWAARLSPDGAMMTYQTSERIAIANVQTGAVQRYINNDGAPFLPMGRSDTSYSPVSFHFAPDSSSLVIPYIRPTYNGYDYDSPLTVMRWGFKGEPPVTVVENLVEPSKVRENAWRYWDVNVSAVNRPELFRLGMSGRYQSGLTFGFSPDARFLYGFIGDDVLRLWDMTTAKAVAMSGPYDVARGASLSLDGARLAVPSGLGVDIVDIASGQTIDQLNNIFNAHQIRGVTYVTDTIIIDLGDRMERWGLAAHNLARVYEFRGLPVVSLDGNLLAIRAKYLTVYEERSGQPRHVFGSANTDDDFAFTPDGQYIALASGQAVGFWSMETGQRERNLASHGPLVGKLAFTPDGARLVSSSGTVWDVTTGKVVATFGVRGDPGAVAISPDGHLIVTGDGALWEGDTGQALGQLAGIRGYPRFVAFTPDGRRLVWQSEDGVVDVWGAAP